MLKFINSCTENECNFYEESLMSYRDMQNALDTAVDDAVKETNIKFIKKSIAEGFDNQLISELTDLSIEQIEEIRKKL